MAGRRRGIPAGISADGITDPKALASTHADRIARRPSELPLTLREFEDGRLVGSYEERVAVSDDWTFVSSIERSGDHRSDYPTIAAVEMYFGRRGAFVHAPAAQEVGRQAILLAPPWDVT